MRKYVKPVSAVSQARIARVQKRGYADRQAGKRREENPYKGRWDRDNWKDGWWDAEIDIAYAIVSEEAESTSIFRSEASSS